MSNLKNYIEKLKEMKEKEQNAEKVFRAKHSSFEEKKRAISVNVEKEINQLQKLINQKRTLVEEKNEQAYKKDVLPYAKEYELAMNDHFEIIKSLCNEEIISNDTLCSLLEDKTGLEWKIVISGKPASSNYSAYPTTIFALVNENSPAFNDTDSLFTVFRPEQPYYKELKNKGGMCMLYASMSVRGSTYDTILWSKDYNWLLNYMQRKYQDYNISRILHKDLINFDDEEKEYEDLIFSVLDEYVNNVCNNTDV